MGDDTTVRVKDDTWRRLRGRKDRGETFDDVINQLIDETESHSERSESPAES